MAYNIGCSYITPLLSHIVLFFWKNFDFTGEHQMSGQGLFLVAVIGTRTTTTCVHAQNPHWLSISKYLRYYQFILNYNPKFRSVSTFQCVSQLCRKREWEGGGVRLYLRNTGPMSSLSLFTTLKF